MTMIKVMFPSNGVSLAGDLYIPDNLTRKAPALPILGPMTFVKEQAPTEYARRLAERGFIALAFDPRYHGESKGEPRRFESPIAKVEDVRAAVDYLQSRADIDADQIFAMAVCQGSSEMLRAVADDRRFKALSTVAGHYRDHEADIEWMGTAAALTERRERGEQAKKHYEETGEVKYVPAVDPERLDVGMPGRFVWDWYSPWAERGIWENRYAVMSDADLLAYESLSAASSIQASYLMIHSDNSFLPNAARRHFEAVPIADKQLSWEGSTGHFQYYEDPSVLDRTADKIADWFRIHLG
ncbi:MAG: alpha/beta hydrolase [Chloroflexales bacterium]|nr:alpha/beta hydrolase [Chloroflexales bacterium]